MAEAGSELVATTMQSADDWVMCRVGYVETARAIGLVAGTQGVTTFAKEWPAFTVIEVDQALAEHAASLTLTDDLRSLDAMHLAACLMLPPNDTALATWDRRLHAAATAAGITCVPEALS